MLLGCQAIAVPPTVAPPLGTGLAPRGATQQATVTDIVDGDTIRVEIGGQEFRVRYIGIDAPEVARDNNPGERLGPEATQANERLVGGRQVILETDTSNTDQFGRLLRYVWLPPGTDYPYGTTTTDWLLVNEELVRLGLADARRYPPDTREQDLLNAAENDARAAGLGLWAN